MLLQEDGEKAGSNKNWVRVPLPSSPEPEVDHGALNVMDRKARRKAVVDYGAMDNGEAPVDFGATDEEDLLPAYDEVSGPTGTSAPLEEHDEKGG